MVLWSSGVHLEDRNRPAEADGEVRLVGGSSGCSGGLELKHLGEWRPVDDYGWNLKIASDGVRLLNGSSRCSGRLQVKTNPSDQTWSSVCEADLDLQDAQVVCRELGCGAPSVLQGELYGDVQTPRWSPEFQCGGHESALLDCRSSGSARSSCSPGIAAGLTCSGVDEFRLVGGASRCAGRVELKYLGDQRPVVDDDFTLKTAAVICEHLNCGSVVSFEATDVSLQSMWRIDSGCFQSGSDLWNCVSLSWRSSGTLNLTCSDGVRLLNGSSRCSGRLPSSGSASEARLKVRLARLKLEAQEKVERRDARLKQQLEIRRLEIEAETAVRMRQLELESQRETHVLRSSAGVAFLLGNDIAGGKVTPTLEMLVVPMYRKSSTIDKPDSELSPACTPDVL
ncbi:scavenger receptor cysteine-rich type 1 protein M130-like [Salarias fasciatus]|uniref:scavenger receptor cysteine-rich type 1 protein M130-like n=1 Tax=Salarias fasciatus TaxID=181472 RepID=UPI001176B698|nr:scavenger receptor cysteine-rich type 1 protein M130-like [Salarias fasciatus]